MNKKSKPFSSGTEYEIFLYTFCERCRLYKLRKDGFPEFPENGGCPILDKMENARFDVSEFPSEFIRELTDAKTGNIIAWHYCNRFDAEDEETQFKHFDLLKKALFENGDKDGE